MATVELIRGPGSRPPQDAVSYPTEARVQVGIAALAAIAGAARLWSGSLLLSASRIAVAGVAVLTLFALWSGITVVARSSLGTRPRPAAAARRLPGLGPAGRFGDRHRDASTGR